MSHVACARLSGARLVGQLQSRVEVHSPRRRRVSVSARVTCAACDIAIASAAEPQEQPALRVMLKQARGAYLSRKKGPESQAVGLP